MCIYIADHGYEEYFLFCTQMRNLYVVDISLCIVRNVQRFCLILQGGV